jgi:glycosyltransferase involved in cell wall biosynthesis
MISALPIISGLADGTELDLIDECNGFVTSEMSEEYLYEKLCHLHENPDVVKKMGKTSFEKITTIFSFDSYMEVFNKCLNYVLNK